MLLSGYVKAAALSLVTLLIVVGTCADAHAGWGSHGSWGSRGYASSGGSWGSHGSRGGPIRNLFARLHARHHSHGSRGYYSSGGYSSGSRGYGSSRGYAYYQSSGGSRGSYYSGGYGGTTIYRYTSPDYPVSPTPAQPLQLNTTPTPAPLPAGQSDTSYRRPAPVRADAVLNVRLPAEAVVYVNGNRTRTPGSFRSYVSKDLVQGRTYTYEVRAEIEQNGQQLVKSETVELVAGGNQTIEFEFNAAEDLQTSVTLHVPVDAQVTLAGVEISGSGPTRVFSTQALKSGESWNDYEVCVTVVRGGQPVTQKSLLTISAGDRLEERFDFDSQKIASTQ